MRPIPGGWAYVTPRGRVRPFTGPRAWGKAVTAARRDEDQRARAKARAALIEHFSGDVFGGVE